MPLKIEDSPNDLSKVDADFVVFYASRDGRGKMWCSDCRDVEAQVKRTFQDATSPSAVIAYVGQKPEWKTPENIFRDDPWKLTAVPTILRVREGKEIGRIVEDDIQRSLDDFVRA